MQPDRRFPGYGKSPQPSPVNTRATRRHYNGTASALEIAFAMLPRLIRYASGKGHCVPVELTRRFRRELVGGWVIGARVYSGSMEEGDSMVNYVVLTETGLVGIATSNNNGGYTLWQWIELSERSLRKARKHDLHWPVERMEVKEQIDEVIRRARS